MTNVLRKSVAIAAASILAVSFLTVSAHADEIQDEYPESVSAELSEGVNSGSVASIGVVSRRGKVQSVTYYGVYDWQYESGSKKLTVTFKESIEAPYGKYASCSSNNFESQKTFLAAPFKDIGDKVESLTLEGFDAVGNCRALNAIKDVTFGKDIETIGDNAFINDASLRSVAFESNSKLKTIKSAAFFGCPLESVDFTNCTTSKELTGDGAEGPFGGGNDTNVSLKSVVLPENLEILGTKMFAGCSSLTQLSLPGGLKEIGSYAFYGTGFQKLELPSGITKIGECAFKDTPKLKYVTMRYNTGMTICSNLRSSVDDGVEGNVAMTELVVLNLTDKNSLPQLGDGMKCVIPSEVIEEIKSFMITGLEDASNIEGEIGNLYTEGLKAVLDDNAKAFIEGKLTAVKALGVINALDVKSLDNEQAFNDAKAGYENLSEAAKDCLSDEVKTEVAAKLADEEKKLNDLKNPSTPVTPPSPGGGSGGGGGAAPAPSQHEHVWDAGTVTVEATCTTPGTKVYKCTVAGCTETKTEEIPALGHKFGEWVVTTPATTTSEGVETRTCSVCGTTETRTIAKLADGTGSGTGADKVTVGSTVKVSGVTYKVTAKGKVVIKVVSKSVKGKKTVTIPATVKIGGKTYKVAGINAGVFKGSKATTLVIKSKDLTKKGVKNSLKGSKVKTVKIAVSGKKSVNKSYASKYKKFFTKGNCGKSVSLKAA